MSAATFLYLISRPPDYPADWEDDISAIVVARDESHARNINPNGRGEYGPDTDYNQWGNWVLPGKVVVTYIGIASMDAKSIAEKNGGVILSNNKGV